MKAIKSIRLPSNLRRAILCHPSTTTAPSGSGAGGRFASSTCEDVDPSALLSLTSATLNTYNNTSPPSRLDVKHAFSYFTRYKPALLFTTPTFRTIPPSPFPEVAFLGRSNVGKSSLLNALFGRSSIKPAHTSKRPGRTKTMNGFSIGCKPVRERKITAPKPDDWKQVSKGSLVVLDMPGYGASSREEWGTEILKYLQNRKQLRRTYLLIDVQSGPKPSDIALLLHLRQSGVPHQIILSKVDKILHPVKKCPSPQSLHKRLLRLEKIRQDVRTALNEAAGSAGGRDNALGDLLCCSGERSMPRGSIIGIDELRYDILTACGLDRSANSEASKDFTLAPDEPRNRNTEELVGYDVMGGG